MRGRLFRVEGAAEVLVLLVDANRRGELARLLELCHAAEARGLGADVRVARAVAREVALGRVAAELDRFLIVFLRMARSTLV